jgi:hypothetical protein
LVLCEYLKKVFVCWSSTSLSSEDLSFFNWENSNWNDLFLFWDWELNRNINYFSSTLSLPSLYLFDDDENDDDNNNNVNYEVNFDIFSFISLLTPSFISLQILNSFLKRRLFSSFIFFVIKRKEKEKKRKRNNKKISYWR